MLEGEARSVGAGDDGEQVGAFGVEPHGLETGGAGSVFVAEDASCRRVRQLVVEARTQLDQALDQLL